MSVVSTWKFCHPGREAACGEVWRGSSKVQLAAEITRGRWSGQPGSCRVGHTRTIRKNARWAEL